MYILEVSTKHCKKRLHDVGKPLYERLLTYTLKNHTYVKK